MSDLSVAREQFQEAELASVGGLDRVRLRHAEEKVRLAKINFEKSLKLKGDSKSDLLELKRLQLRYDLAKLNLALLNSPIDVATIVQYLHAKIDRMSEEILSLDQRVSKGPHGGTAAPLRGEKGTSWEGGYRVPGIFRRPGRIQPSVINDLAANLDLYATLAFLTKGSQPTQKLGYISVDLTGVLTRNERSPRQQWSYGPSAFRSGKYKIHLTTKDRSSNPDTRAKERVKRHDPPLLFDLQNDISEQHNLAAERPQVVARLLEEMKSFGRGR